MIMIALEEIGKRMLISTTYKNKVMDTILMLSKSGLLNNLGYSHIIQAMEVLNMTYQHV